MRSEWSANEPLVAAPRHGLADEARAAQRTHWTVSANAREERRMLSDQSEGTETHYWYSKSRRSSLTTLCEWAVDEASTAKEIASVARLVAGAGLSDVLGPTIEAKILDRLRDARDAKRPTDALKDARWMGEALETLRRG